MKRDDEGPVSVEAGLLVDLVFVLVCWIILGLAVYATLRQPPSPDGDRLQPHAEAVK